MHPRHPPASRKSCMLCAATAVAGSWMQVCPSYGTYPTTLHRDLVIIDTALGVRARLLDAGLRSALRILRPRLLRGRRRRSICRGLASRHHACPRHAAHHVPHLRHARLQVRGHPRGGRRLHAGRGLGGGRALLPSRCRGHVLGEGRHHLLHVRGHRGRATRGLRRAARSLAPLGGLSALLGLALLLLLVLLLHLSHERLHARHLLREVRLHEGLHVLRGDGRGGAGRGGAPLGPPR
mmetsp:Transcript_64970/g.159977  ORF Transcript_64970/g.159977 Transcript_64970/m.159977 type:complete len:237 (-) Transcript_64970:363-1073(-)